MDNANHIPAAPTNTEPQDLHLISQVLRKDRKATAEFVERYADCVYAYVGKRVMPRSEAVADLVQEVFLAAWENLANYRGEAGIRAWLLGIARHKVQDHYRRLLREVELSDDDEPRIFPVFDEQMDEKARRHKIQDVLNDLPESYSLVLIWRYKEDRSIREMAQLAGKTEKAMERLLARSRDQFRRRWNRGHP